MGTALATLVAALATVDWAEEVALLACSIIGLLSVLDRVSGAMERVLGVTASGAGDP